MRKNTIVAVTGVVFVALASGCSSSSEEAVGSVGSKQSIMMFCPNAPVPRKDMARYLERLQHGRDFVPPAPRRQFSDVRDPIDQAWVEALFADGITKGCGGTSFCPEESVPREQMAAFIMRLVHGPDFDRKGPSRFVDVNGGSEQFAGYIEQLADDGITKGCDATHFCPRDVVPRDQMAAFLMRAKYPGSVDPAASGRFVDVPREHVLAGRMEQAVIEGIMEPCGGKGTGGSGAFSFPEPGSVTKTFKLHAKSSIQHVNQWESPPIYTAPSQRANWFGLLVATNKAYEEYPAGDWWGAQEEDGKFRLYGEASIRAYCQLDGTSSKPWIQWTYEAAGKEAGFVPAGINPLATRIDKEGAGWQVHYVLSGDPNPFFSLSLDVIRWRSRTAIFQYGTIHVGCSGATPTATMNTYEGPSFGGSSFPSHSAWLFDASSGNQQVDYFHIDQAYSSDPDGAGMKDLWNLPEVPPP